jgi:hypothetical protein
MSIPVLILLTFMNIPVNAQTQSNNSDETGITRYVYADPLPQWASFDSGVVDRAINAWEDANPNLTLQLVSSPDNADLHIVWAKDPSDSAQIETQYGLKGSPSNGVTILPRLSGLSYTTIIVTLGNETVVLALGFQILQIHYQEYWNMKWVTFLGLITLQTHLI